MTNRELDELLRSAPVPDEREAFRANLPGNVLRELRRPLTDLPASKRLAWPQLVETLLRNLAPGQVGLALGVICLALLLTFILRPGPGLRITDQQLAEARKCYHEVVALFPHQVRAIALNDHAPALQLSDRADVPDAEPVLLEVIGPADRASFVVITGQEFSFAGKQYEVLLDHQGAVLVIGPDLAWSSIEPTTPDRALQICARTLDSAM